MAAYIIDALRSHFPQKLGLALTLLSGICLSAGCATPGPQNLVVPELSASFEPGTILSAERKQPVAFETMIDDLAEVRIVYVGETHTNPVHHDIQLKILEALYSRHPDLAVGFEMFDKTYQDVLEQWYSGQFDEQTFLRKTHWYANWKYDFSLYRDLLEFIRDHRIPLYGLNIPFHIPPKIAVGGISSLSAREKSYLPEQMDFSNPRHRQYVKNIFQEHPHSRSDFDFESFYAAQVAWEEVMAETISRHVDNRFLVAIVGNGHITHRFGIPQRAWQRVRLPYRTVMPATAGTAVELSAADYIWVTPEAGQPPHMPPP